MQHLHMHMYLHVQIFIYMSTMQIFIYVSMQELAILSRVYGLYWIQKQKLSSLHIMYAR